ncbi:MAG: hypothetical protein VW421_00765 [Gammaproteobacteria bacterium]
MLFDKRGPQRMFMPESWTVDYVEERFRELRPPIVISFFDRYSHLNCLLETILKSKNVDEYDIFVVQDAHPTTVHDKKEQENLKIRIAQMRHQTAIHFVERESNYGVGINARSFGSSAIEVADSCIFLEDDLEVAPGFLEFATEGISQALKNPHKILGVNGYMPPLPTQTKDGSISPILMKRFHGWGVGHIGYHWKQIQWPSIQDYRLLIDHFRDEINDNLGPDVWNMIRGTCFGVLDAGDVSVWVYCLLNRLSVITPSVSLTKNNGFDGSGQHSVKTNAFDIKTLPTQTEFDWEQIKESPKMIKKAVEFRNLMAVGGEK